MKLTDLTPEKRAFILFVSHSGDGKTYAGVSFPKPLWIADFDGRARGGLAARNIVEDLDQITVDYFPPGTIDNYFEKLNILEIQAKTGSFPYQTVFIDGLTNQTRATISEVMKYSKGKPLRDARGEKDKLPDKKSALRRYYKSPAPGDYAFEASQTNAVMDVLRILPCNVIVSCHYVDRYGKADPNDTYSETVVTGEKLSIRDKLGENIQTYFPEVYKFSRNDTGNRVQHFVKFRGDIARTSYDNLPYGELEVTDTNFYEFWLKKIKGD